VRRRRRAGAGGLGVGFRDPCRSRARSRAHQRLHPQLVRTKSKRESKDENESRRPSRTRRRRLLRGIFSQDLRDHAGRERRGNRSVDMHRRRRRKDQGARADPALGLHTTHPARRVHGLWETFERAGAIWEASAPAPTAALAALAPAAPRVGACEAWALFRLSAKK
jgi:hypothetical protein